MQVSFYLDKSNLDKDGFAPIFYSFTFSGNRIRKKIKTVKTQPEHWNEKTHRIKAPKKTKEYNFYIEYNKILDDFESRTKGIIRHYLLSETIPSKKELVAKIESNAKITLTNEFFPSFQEFIDTSKNQKAERTIKGYITFRNFLKDFEEYEDSIINFDSITNILFEKLRDYAFDEKRIATNYFSKLVGILKTFMKWAEERGYHQNNAYTKFIAKEHETEVIYLTMEELMKLYNNDFKNQRLSQVRDVYCFGCFTGLRYSDLKKLKISNIFENSIKLNIQKTKAIDHTIPLNNFAKKILSRYIDTIQEPLPIISSQKFNKYIKECAKIVGIDTPTTTTRYIGQKRIDKTVPKYELITSHTARKTFVTNSLILGMNQMVVRNITGHKKEETFKKYVKIAESFRNQEMDNTWNKLKS